LSRPKKTKSADSVINQAQGARWLSFPPLDAHPLVLHGFLIKSRHASMPGRIQQTRSLLRRITSRKSRLVSLIQKHQDRCAVITAGDELKSSYQGDAILTNRTDVIISVQVADCPAIYLVEEKGKAIGLVHAGWRGTLLGILPRTLERARSELNCRASEFTAVIGPCIQGCCYQVSDSVAVLFDEKCMGRPQRNRTTLDLTCVNVKQLLDCGVKEDRIFKNGECTCCNGDLFFSHRREGISAGRMTAFLGLK
jgi:YfiH family protein